MNERTPAPAQPIQQSTEPYQSHDGQKPTTSLIADILGNVSSLVRHEVDLARAEINQNLSRAATAVGLLVGAAVIALVALNVLAASAVAALTAAGISGGWSALIIGGALAVIAVALVIKGTNDLKLSSIAPTRTLDNIHKSAQNIKESI